VPGREPFVDNLCKFSAEKMLFLSANQHYIKPVACVSNAYQERMARLSLLRTYLEWSGLNAVFNTWLLH